ncbi:MAG: sugar ABC transporter substrate-binding protein [Armatimonadetes bacterium]|nr:sugar ABC transporter substrate-binding protein [Armatimonadota bacterium]
MKRMMWWGLLLLAVMAGLAGCSKQEAQNAGQPPSAPSAPRNRPKVRFLAMEYDTNTRPYMEKVKADFAKAHPEIDLDIEIVSWDQGHEKLATYIAGKRPPDLANVATIWLSEYVGMGKVEPLDAYMKESMRKEFFPFTLERASYDGKLYGLPFAVSARALYYNKDLLAKAGGRPPKNWDELVAVSKKITDPARKVYGFGVQGAKVETDTYFYYFLWANGGDIVNDQGECILHRPEAVEALQFEVDLAHKHKATQPEPTGSNREGLQDLFKTGRLGMMITGPWFWQMLDKEAPDTHYGLAPVPKNKEQITMRVTDNVMMFNTSENKEAAWKFLEFLYEDARRLEFDKTFGMLPEKETVARDAYIQQNPNWKFFMDLLPIGKFQPRHKDWERISQEVIKAVQAALLKEKTPRQALDEAKTRIDGILKKG